jgi:hypothetical protein
MPIHRKRILNMPSQLLLFLPRSGYTMFSLDEGGPEGPDVIWFTEATYRASCYSWLS